MTLVSDEQMWHVGVHVRDQLLDLQSKDIDIAVECNKFSDLVAHIEATHKSIFQVREEFLTVRALTHEGQPRDYVMCRKDGAYSDSRHPDEVIPGSILDDLARRDFTVNAIAINLATGDLLDPYNGIEDLKNGVLRCVGNTLERFQEDGLRILRAFRFMITRGLAMDDEILTVLSQGECAALLHGVSEERMSEELYKCFRANTYATMRMITVFAPEYLEVIFKDTKIWLMPTNRA